MFHWIGRILAALSLIMCLTTATMAVRSYWWFERVEQRSPDGGMSIESGGGYVMVRFHDMPQLPGTQTFNDPLEDGLTDTLDNWYAKAQTRIGFSRFGFSVVRPKVQSLNTYSSMLVLPYWFLFLIAALLPAARWWRWRRTRCRGRVHAGEK